MIASLVLRYVMYPWGLWLLHRVAFFATHGPSSLCVDFINYLGCQDPTTAYPRRGSWRDAVKEKRECERGSEIIVENWRAKIRCQMCTFREQKNWAKDNIVTHCSFLQRKRSAIHSSISWLFTNIFINHIREKT